ncbi:outer membrane efflux protein [Bacteriovorax sp. BSW11_IV]|uniref:TolC family protein n=1 Tax=Bacteriovorax sp. BSW11_IV TaxID=1353529 RepID=UPI00038A341A|nr:TolC family protein [Bacteriovorax sp. BSW11_IV]EQC50166.1 outer membrane efflux protein [Bacteriovorax sp. BSW11_IV]
MKHQLALLATTMTFGLAAHAKTTKIDESFLKKQLTKNSPTVQNIEANFLSLKLQESSVLDKFSYQVTGEANYMKTSEKPFSTFSPVTSPVKSASVGITRPTTLGMNFGVKGYSEQFSNNFVQNGTTTGIAVQFQMDLFKDFLGGLTRNQIEALEYGRQTGDIEKDIQTKAFYQELRKLYWKLVANQESLRLSEELLNSSKTQAEEARRRFKNNIADSGEVARYESQVAARKANIIALKFEKESLVQSLKQLLPEIANDDIQLAPYNLNMTVLNVLACTAKIESYPSIPLENTRYDEILNNLKLQYESQEKVTDRYNNIDVKLNTEYKKIGKEFNFSNSVDELKNEGGNSVAVGLTINIPLDSKKSTTEEIQHLVEKKRFMAKQDEVNAKLTAYHTQVVKNIAFLQEIVKEQQINSQKLEHSLSVTKKKFNQARISVRELINDQDAYLQSNLSEIQTKYNVIATLLDYLSVYTETPCALNNL